MARSRPPGLTEYELVSQKLADARAQLEKWSTLAASPNLSPAAALAARNLQRSWQAVTGLYEKGLQYEIDRLSARRRSGSAHPDAKGGA